LLGQNVKQEVRVFCFYTCKENEERPFCEAIDAFAKTLAIEHPRLPCRLIKIVKSEKEDLTPNEWSKLFYREWVSQTNPSLQVCYKEENRLVKGFQSLLSDNQNTGIKDSSSQQVSLRNKGTYLISGGAGGLGFIFARYLMDEVKANVVLLGRSPLNAEKSSQLSYLQSLEGDITYLQTDITQKECLAETIKSVKKTYREINGVIHSAGVIKDAFVAKKTIRFCERNTCTEDIWDNKSGRVDSK